MHPLQGEALCTETTATTADGFISSRDEIPALPTPESPRENPRTVLAPAPSLPTPVQRSDEHSSPPEPQYHTERLEAAAK
jgi:hypothetical protein